MTIRMQMLIECRSEVLWRIFGLIARYASDVSQIRLTRCPGPNLGRMDIALEPIGNPRDLTDELCLVIGIRKISIRST
jgi:hypothetical protein